MSEVDVLGSRIQALQQVLQTPYLIAPSPNRVALGLQNAFNYALAKASQTPVCQSIGYMVCMITSPGRAAAIANVEGRIGALGGLALAPMLATELLAAEGATVAARALTEADLGLTEGSLQTLQGTYSVTNGIATAQIDMIEGTISNPFGVIRGLSATAGADGAQSLVIQGTIANEQLFNILSVRYGLTSQGAIDTLTIPLGGP
jgi:hypothetical protein